jgi:putative ABC transport system permease protein
MQATSRACHVYDATVLHTLGARVASIRTSLSIEYALIALLVSVFAIVLGGAIALALLEIRLRLPAAGIWWAGAAVAVLVSGALHRGPAPVSCWPSTRQHPRVTGGAVGSPIRP